MTLLMLFPLLDITSATLLAAHVFLGVAAILAANLAPQRPPRDPNTCSGHGPARSTSRGNGATMGVSSLTPDEVAELDACERTIERFERASLDAGRALRRIREGRLYRGVYGTFEAYVVDRWSFGLRRAEQLMSAVDALDTLAEAGVADLPRNEAQVRPIASLEGSEMVAVWERVLDEHGGAGHASKAKVEAAREAPLGHPLRTTPAPTPEEADSLSVPNPTSDWSEEARRALRKAPKEHRATIATLLNSTAGPTAVPGGVFIEITAEVVAEAIEAFGAMALEDGLDEQAALVGEAAHLVDAVRSEAACASTGAAGSVDDPIPDLDVLCTDELEHDAGTKRNVTFIGSGEKRPLLVSIPRSIAPTVLTAHLPAEAKQVIVDVGEFERLGGPVTDGVLDVDVIRAAAREAEVKRTLTRTNEHVDWARFTSNPITGCWHSCREVFCYAAGIAQRLFAQGFLPTLYPTRLDHFRNTPLPDVSGLEHDEAWRERSVFMVSMGDLFGGWVPAWYVEHVLDEVRRHPGWFAFFLTKNPARLGDFSFPPNAAVGLTITGDDKGFGRSLDAAEQRIVYEKLAGKLGRVEGAAFTWLSLEPFRAPVHDLTPFVDAGVRMVAVGGQSRTSFCEPFQPEIAWVERVRAQVRAAGLRLFEKENLTARPKEIPFPDGFPASR